MRDKVSSSHGRARGARLIHKAAVMRRVTALAVAAISIGSAALAAEPSQTSLWKRVSAEGLPCVSYSPVDGKPVDLNVRLKPKFEATLLSQLHPPAERRTTYCWYETPTGSLRLWTGGLCGDGTEAHFELGDNVWKLASEWPIYIECK